MMRIEDGDDEEEDAEEEDRDDEEEEVREGDQAVSRRVERMQRRLRRTNDIDAGNSSSDEDEGDGAPPQRQSKEAIRAEGQAIRDSVLSGYFGGNF